MKTTFLLCACVAGLTLATPVWAQQSDATDALGSVTSTSSFGRDRNVGVMERPRPAYQAEAIQLGSWEVMPRLAVGAGYEDNVYAQRTNKIDDAYTRIRPRLSIARPSPNLTVAVSGELDLLRYLDRTTENQTQYNVDGKLLYTISRDTSFSLTGSHGRYAQERVSPDSPDNVTRPVRFTVTQGTATLKHSFNRLRIQGVLDVENRHYRDGVTPAGLVVDQTFRDQTTITGTGIGEYALSPSISFFIAGSYNSRDYKTRIGPVPARDSRGYEIAAGSSFELGHKMRGALRLGYLEQNYRDPFFRDVSGLLVRGELAYFMTPLVTLTAKVDRAVSETGIIGASGYLKTTSSVRADYELLRNLILSASAELEKRDFQNLDRKDDRWTLGAGGTYLVSKRISLSGNLQHRSQSSWGAFPGRQFKDNRVSVGVTFSGL